MATCRDGKSIPAVWPVQVPGRARWHHGSQEHKESAGAAKKGFEAFFRVHP